MMNYYIKFAVACYPRLYSRCFLSSRMHAAGETSMFDSPVFIGCYSEMLAQQTWHRNAALELADGSV